LYNTPDLGILPKNSEEAPLRSGVIKNYRGNKNE